MNPLLSALQTPPFHPETKAFQPSTSRIISPVSETQETTMMSTKTLIRLVKKCQKVADMRKEEAHLVIINVCGRNQRVLWHIMLASCRGKGRCIVYTADGPRFELPLAFLGSTVFGELLRMSQEKFGFAGVDSGRITLPCDASVMDYAMRLLRRSASAEMEVAFLHSMVMPCHYHAAAHLRVSQHFGICSS